MNAEKNAELTQAIQRLNEGRLEEAQAICSRVLARDPDNIDALNILGGSLSRAGRIAEAIEAAEKVCSLRPGDAVFHGNLSYLHGVNGNFQQAMLSMAHAVVADPRNTIYHARLARLVNHMEFYRLTDETAVVREAIGICLGNPALNAADFSTAWHSLLLLDPGFMELAALTEGDEFRDCAEQVTFDALEKPLADPFVLQGLRSLHAQDPRLERILTFLRRLFLSHRDEYDHALFLPFLCALAEHCMLNEYVYRCTPDERVRIDELEARLELPPGRDARARAGFALVCCYRDSLPIDRAGLAAGAGTDLSNDPFLRLIGNIVSIPQLVRAYGDTIATVPRAGDSGPDRVSAAVARQYEENPYPRWRHLDIPQLTGKQRSLGRGKRILVAGCGTGYEPLNLAVHYPEAEVVAIDLSLPSLAYGRHKAVEFGIDNVRFMQADILELGDFGQRFDLITSMGVLHHMEAPIEGWRRLLELLDDDGFMKVGLYSRLGRQSVALCRDWIRTQGFEPTPDGIRAFRQAIMALDASSPLREIMNWTDFYSMSMCRDLVFHVQEHNVSIPWIRAALEELGLSLLSMRISNPLFRREYRSRHPDDRNITNFDYLDRSENHNPALFRDMYQFWCCRKNSKTAARPPAWFYTLDEPSPRA